MLSKIVVDLRLYVPRKGRLHDRLLDCVKVREKDLSKSNPLGTSEVVSEGLRHSESRSGGHRLLRRVVATLVTFATCLRIDGVRVREGFIERASLEETLHNPATIMDL